MNNEDERNHEEEAYNANLLKEENPYEGMSTIQLLTQIDLYKKDIVLYEAMRDSGRTWYYNSEFGFLDFDPWDSGMGEYRGRWRAYDVTEDLAFLYTEVGRCYYELMQRQGQ
jgi:hypothetical protein